MLNLLKHLLVFVGVHFNLKQNAFLQLQERHYSHTKVPTILKYME